MKALWIGFAARQTLAQKQEVSLLGITSHGMFLHTASQRVLFLSRERYRGPLTINVDGLIEDGLLERQGDPVTIQTEGVWFPKSALWIAVAEAAEWNPPPCAKAVLSPTEMDKRIEAVCQRISARDDLAMDGMRDTLTEALQNNQAAQVSNLVSPYLGRGTGLTPAGDDLVMGLLLALNRWGHVFLPEFPVGRLNSLLVSEAYARTTTLSANLIECASVGQADERLVTGLDGLVTGIPGAAACAALFNQWGSTSGGSAFVGMKLALTCRANRANGPDRI